MEVERTEPLNIEKVNIKLNYPNFVDELKKYKGRDVFNPYINICSKYDREDANEIRSANLQSMFKSKIDCQVNAIWLGRDLGHRGGRRTGIALTDESNLNNASDLWDVELRQATKGEIVSERTAVNIWSALRRINENIFMWNVFPFHPHEHNRQFTNRSHNTKERNIGLEILQELVQLLKPEKIVAIGNDAYTCARKVFNNNDVFKVRHPSYGGEKVFSRQISDLYNIHVVDNYHNFKQYD